MRLLACIVLMLTALPAFSRASTADAPTHVTIEITDARLDCDDSFALDRGITNCDIDAVLSFTAQQSAMGSVFGHCETTIEYKTRDGLVPNHMPLFEPFSATILDGRGSVAVTLRFRPFRLSFDPIIDVTTTDILCSVDDF